MSNAAPRIETALKSDEPTALRDPYIRERLHYWLRAAHADRADTEIIHELKIPRPSGRVDLAVVNGEFCGFEIKSDVDSLTRLSRQSRAFSAVFDRVSVVTTPKHLEAVRTAIPSWWGVIVVSRCIGSVLSFIPDDQNAKINPHPDIEALLHMLYRRELISVLETRALDVGLRTKTRKVLIDVIVKSLSATDIKSEARRVFKLRVIAPHSSSLSSPYLRMLSGA